MSKWDGCPIVACKNDLCDRECQHLAREKLRAWAERQYRKAVDDVNRMNDKGEIPRHEQGEQP